MWTFIETPKFSRARDKYLSDDEFSALQAILNDNPKVGVVMPDADGIRKLRLRRKGMGKRGGLRVIYYHKNSAGQILLLDLYAKNRRSSIEARQARRLKDDF